MRDHFNKNIKVKEDKIHPIIKIIMLAYKSIPRTVSTLYKCLMESRQESTVYVKVKWERELNQEIIEKVWYETWKEHKNTTQSLKWRELIRKNQICYFITPKIKNKQTNTQQQCWRLCGWIEPDHAHIFLEMQKNSHFLGQNSLSSL